MHDNRFPNPALSRRKFLSAAAAGTASLGLAGCVSVPSTQKPVVIETPPKPDPQMSSLASMYGPLQDGPYLIPAVPFEKIPSRFHRQEVADPTGERPGTIVVDVSQHFLYLVRPRGRAMRYGVGLGRAGFEWSGKGVIERKAEWPRWHPPAEMIERQPELEKYRTTYNKATKTWEGGMDGGLNNPLGARAHYIYQDGKDTLYRVHGSPEWWTIGKSVSSGCVRMINQDVIDLYGRVTTGSPILVTNGLGVS
ncbi:L,D-transpeptidase family protein [Nitratireductor sp. CH_MIT9313-5]|uniref:L,D-transpeptidase family protein n=1 Tax=Nitratireductor sp. CH_MIT9313-5 TaxID=3107764 RepID=UPI00300BC393